MARGPWVQGDEHWVQRPLNAEQYATARWHRSVMRPGADPDAWDDGWDTEVGDEFPYVRPAPPLGIPQGNATYVSVGNWDEEEQRAGLVTYEPVVAQFSLPAELSDPYRPLPISPLDWPAGAIGYEWETEFGEWVQEGFTAGVEGWLSPWDTAEFSVHPQAMRLLARSDTFDLANEYNFPSRDELRKPPEATEPPDPLPPGWKPPPLAGWGTVDVQLWPVIDAPEGRVSIQWEILYPEWIVSVIAIPDKVYSKELDGELTIGASMNYIARRDFRPPRHRFIFPGGLWRTRQRQTAPGSDSWPIRQRNNAGHSGSWPLRQRQTRV